MSISRGHDGPKAVLARCPRASLELISDLAQDDPDVWWSGAAMMLWTHGSGYRVDPRDVAAVAIPTLLGDMFPR